MERNRKLYYLSPRDVRKNRADAVHMMMSCLGFFQHGLQVTLVTPRVFRSDWRVGKKEFWGLYGQKPTFRVSELPTVVWENTWLERTMRLQQVCFCFLMFLWLGLCEKLKPDAGGRKIIYGKCYSSTAAAIAVRTLLRCEWLIVFEKPDPYKNSWLHRFVCTGSDKLVAVTNTTKSELINNYSIPEASVKTLPFFAWTDVLNEQLHPTFSRINDRFLVMYGGKIDRSIKEVSLIIDAAKLAPELEFLLVGARNVEKEFLSDQLAQRGIANIRIEGFQPLLGMWKFARAADLLISYYDSSTFSSFYRSPAKLAMYFCAGKPIVVSDLPGLRQLFPNDLVTWVKPDCPKTLADKILEVSQERSESQLRGKQCLEFGLSHNGYTAMGEILHFLETDEESQ